MAFEIIDFHTHPFIEPENHICSHKAYCNMSVESTVQVFRNLGVSKICGSVIGGAHPDDLNVWQKIKRNNDTALKLKNIYNGFYIPGFHIHPEYIDESIAEMDRMRANGVRLIGELVPYIDGWSNYSSEAFSVLLEEAGMRSMIVSFHSQEEDEMDKMVKDHLDVVFIAAHPGEYHAVLRHIQRMKMSENYYLDLSGTGLFRYGMLRRMIDDVGSDRILFGSDYPTCNPGMFLGGVLFDNLLTDEEKEKIFSLNAKRLLGL